MRKLVECVPNISEGRSAVRIGAVVAAVSDIQGVHVLHVDSNADANRTVITLAGEQEAMLRAMFALVVAARENIDMRRHTGVHPRIGAIDVCPFVPLRGSTMEDCISLSRRLGERVGTELGIPVFLYEASQEADYRRSLSDIRRGEFEGLEGKLKDPLWRPDYGPVKMDPVFGALITGARQFLVAFNVNLRHLKLRDAKRIAGELRTSGRWVTLPTGLRQHLPGALPACKAIGWHYPERDIIQVSTNITDFTKNGMHDVYELCRKFAMKAGGDVHGSELIGLVPEAAVFASGRFYNPKAQSEAELLQAADERLGLSSLGRFIPEIRIIERQLASLEQ